jgi:hypothetical protein
VRTRLGVLLRSRHRCAGSRGVALAGAPAHNDAGGIEAAGLVEFCAECLRTHFARHLTLIRVEASSTASKVRGFSGRAFEQLTAQASKKASVRAFIQTSH